MRKRVWEGMEDSSKCTSSVLCTSTPRRRGAQWAAGDDPRVTPFGRKLRTSRLDEIPQFWNVVKGDMSLIGPRPERPVFHEAFKERIDGWEQRLAVRPGITGLAQVEGGYELLPKEKALLDIEYIENPELRPGFLSHYGAPCAPWRPVRGRDEDTLSR